MLKAYLVGERSMETGLMTLFQDRISPVFLAHGAPTLAVDDTLASRFLKSFGQTLPKPKFILIQSAHWETDGVNLSAPGPLRTYHDFRGFSPELYEISYPASTPEGVVDEVAKCLEVGGYELSWIASMGLITGPGCRCRLLLRMPIFQLSRCRCRVQHAAVPLRTWRDAVFICCCGVD